ncbi:hypothetical protein BB558_006870 [Smittium angustum]|uniref:DNA polymerase delta subunit 3 n=1 Tax=Smittium angustum TaxID=133377 RepID=A0A2U1IWL0_SMIAN|nr:hypothetical protein BB558_006870 [Smittium angustum]
MIKDTNVISAILDEQGILTTRMLSKKLNISNQSAQNELTEFVNNEGSKYGVCYLVSGYKKKESGDEDSNSLATNDYYVKIVEKSQVEDFKKTLGSSEVTIYSIQKKKDESFLQDLTESIRKTKISPNEAKYMIVAPGITRKSVESFVTESVDSPVEKNGFSKNSLIERNGFEKRSPIKAAEINSKKSKSIESSKLKQNKKDGFFKAKSAPNTNNSLEPTIKESSSLNKKEEIVKFKKDETDVKPEKEGKAVKPKKEEKVKTIKKTQKSLVVDKKEEEDNLKKEDEVGSTLKEESVQVTKGVVEDIVVNKKKSKRYIISDESDSDNDDIDTSVDTPRKTAEADGDVIRSLGMEGESKDGPEGMEKAGDESKRRRKRVKVEKVRHYKNERGMLVTKVEEGWESHSDKSSQASLMNFFSKK